MSAKQKKMLKHFLGLLLRYCILAGLCFLIIYPLFTKIVVAFMEKGDLYDSSVVYIPKHFTLSNIRISAETIDYGVCLIKTVLMVGGCSAMQVLSCMLTGYGFARFKIPFGRIIFGFVILTLIVPIQTVIVPLYFYFTDLHLIGTAAPLFLLSATTMGIRNGLYIYMFRYR